MIAPRVRDRKSFDEMHQRKFERSRAGILRRAVAGSINALFGRSVHRGSIMQSRRSLRKPFWLSIAESETMEE